MVRLVIAGKPQERLILQAERVRRAQIELIKAQQARVGKDEATLAVLDERASNWIAATAANMIERYRKVKLPTLASNPGGVFWPLVTRAPIPAPNVIKRKSEKSEP